MFNQLHLGFLGHRRVFKQSLNIKHVSGIRVWLKHVHLSWAYEFGSDTSVCLERSPPGLLRNQPIFNSFFCYNGSCLAGDLMLSGVKP